MVSKELTNNTTSGLLLVCDALISSELIAEGPGTEIFSLMLGCASSNPSHNLLRAIDLGSTPAGSIKSQ